MAFTFGSGAAPAFGAPSAPAFSFGGAAPATTAFGAASAPAFGSTSAPSLFGATPAPSLFGATGASPFGGAVATPPFGTGAAPSLFGATPAPAFGASAPSLFGAPAGAAPSLFGGAAPSLFGAPPQQQQAAPPTLQLATKENRLVTHSTKWEDLSPQAQQDLLALEKIVSQCREECRQLDGEPRLAPGGGAAAPGSALDGAARSLSQGIASLQARVGGDSEETAAVRGEVMSLLRHTDAAMHAFKRTHAWREAARAAPGQPLPSHVAEALGGPVALPSAFLGETVDRYGERLRAHQAAAADLEAALRQPGGGGGGGGPAAAAAALQASIANVHDCLLRAAARLQGVDDRVAAARAAHLARRRQAGDFSDPFEEAARAQAAAAAKVAARAQAEQQQQQQQQQAQLAQQQQQPGFALLGAPPVQATPAASPAGLFGTLAPAAAAPAAAGGLFGNVAPPATGSASATTRRRAGRR